MNASSTPDGLLSGLRALPSELADAAKKTAATVAVSIAIVAAPAVAKQTAVRHPLFVRLGSGSDVVPDLGGSAVLNGSTSSALRTLTALSPSGAPTAAGWKRLAEELLPGSRNMTPDERQTHAKVMKRFFVRH